MSGKIICVVNRKGGVGKTTLSLALSDALAAETIGSVETDAPTVVAVDLDPQASLTAALLFNKKSELQASQLQALSVEGRTIGAAVALRLNQTTKAAPLLTYGRGPSAAPYVLAGNDAAAWDVERRALRRPGASSLIAATQQVLEDLASQFRYVVVDCPPGQTVMAEAALLKADLLLCPTTPDRLALWGLETFQTYLRELFEEHERKPPKAFWIVMKHYARAAKDGPQTDIMAQLDAFRRPRDVVTLLVESGQEGLGGPIVVPLDAAIAKRLEGPRRLTKVWPWDAAYKVSTRQALARLMRAVVREVADG